MLPNTFDKLYDVTTGKPIELLYPSYEPVTVEIFRKDPALGLGLYVVGGQDTPLRHVHVQDVLYESVCWKDGRIKSGDILYEVSMIFYGFIFCV